MEDNTTAWQTVQDSLMSTGDFDKFQFIRAVELMTPEEFNRFCREILHLTHFYDSNRGAWVTDMKQHIEKHKEIFWQLSPIDFNDLPGFGIAE